MGDYRTYDHTVGIRAVTSIDGMTSDFARIDWEACTQVELSMRWTTLIALSMTLP